MLSKEVADSSCKNIGAKYARSSMHGAVKINRKAPREFVVLSKKIHLCLQVEKLHWYFKMSLGGNLFIKHFQASFKLQKSVPKAPFITDENTRVHYVILNQAKVDLVLYC